MIKSKTLAEKCVGKNFIFYQIIYLITKIKYYFETIEFVYVTFLICVNLSNFARSRTKRIIELSKIKR